MNPDDKICYCYNVPYRKLWNFACRERLQRPSQMSQCLGAGTGCGWCIPFLKKIFAQAQQAQNASTDETPQVEQGVSGLTPEEYAEARQAYIRENRPRNQF